MTVKTWLNRVVFSHIYITLQCFCYIQYILLWQASTPKIPPAMTTLIHCFTPKLTLARHLFTNANDDVIVWILRVMSFNPVTRALMLNWGQGCLLISALLFSFAFRAQVLEELLCHHLGRHHDYLKSLLSWASWWKHQWPLCFIWYAQARKVSNISRFLMSSIHQKPPANRSSEIMSTHIIHNIHIWVLMYEMLIWNSSDTVYTLWK